MTDKYYVPSVEELQQLYPEGRPAVYEQKDREGALSAYLKGWISVEALYDAGLLAGKLAALGRPAC